MDDVVDVHKKTLFSRAIDIINKLFGHRGTKRVRQESRFRQFLNGIDKNSPEYDDVVRVVELCDEAVLSVVRRIAYIERLRKVDAQIAEVECFNKLSDDNAVRLKDLLDRFASLMRDRNALRNQLMGFDRSLMYMERIEGDAKGALPEIAEAEDKQRMFRNDIAYLEAENSELEYESGNLATGLRFIHGFTITLLFVFGGAVLLLGYQYFRGANVLLLTVVLVCMTILLFALIYAFRRRVLFEISMNTKKRRRAVELTNKKTAVLAHYTNYLNYEYGKYKVRNSSMLKDTISDYGRYKYIQARLDSIRGIMYQTEKEIQDFLAERDMSDVITTIESFASRVDITDKREYYRELMQEHDKIEINLRNIDESHEKIWDKLFAYQQSENVEDGLIQTIIQSCIDETGKIIDSSARREEQEEKNKHEKE